MLQGTVPLQFWSRTSRLESETLVCLIFQTGQQMIFATIEQEPQKMKIDQHRWLSLLLCYLHAMMRLEPFASMCPAETAFCMWRQMAGRRAVALPLAEREAVMQSTAGPEHSGGTRRTRDAGTRRASLAV